MNAPDATAIQKSMEEVRCDLDEDVQEIVEGARDMGDWRSYVRTYPWICIGVALAIGYLIVPRRVLGSSPVVPMDHQPANEHRPLAESYSPTKRHADSGLWGFVGNLVMRGIVSFVGEQADKFFVRQTANPPQNNRR